MSNDLVKALEGLYAAIRDRHHGRMPIEVQEAYDAAGKALAAHRAQASEPAKGWKLVPVEPTQAMCKAAVVFANGNAVYKNVAAAALEIEEGIYGEAYAAMLAASPQPEPMAARVPLSEEQINAVMVKDQVLNYNFMLNSGAGPCSARGLAVFRAVERAHGIGKEGS